MKVKESIKDLMRISRASREDGFYILSWRDRMVGYISVYFIKLFLKLGISANQTSIMALIITVIGGALLIFPNPILWIIGVVLLLFCEMLGQVDGGIARYHKTNSPRGAFWNSIPEQFVLIYTPICSSFGLYSALQNIYPFVVGFLTIIALFMTTSMTLLPYPILRHHGTLLEALDQIKQKNPRADEGTSVKRGRSIFHLQTMLALFIISSVIDYYVSPFTIIGTFLLDARFIVCILYAMLHTASAVRHIYLQLRYGVRLVL